MKYLTISNSVFDVLFFNGIFCYIPNICTYPLGTHFYRIRRLNETLFPNPDLQVLTDFWNPPKEYVTTYGRLNKLFESLLYTAPKDPKVCIDEMKIKQNEYFALIKYTAKSNIKVNMIGGDYNYDALGIKDRKSKLIHEIYNNFLKDEFSRDIGEGTEFLYKISESIAKDFFDLPPRDVQDAWAYS